MRRQLLPNCLRGQGGLDGIIRPRGLEAPQLRFLHDDVLALGASIGVHAHADNYYYYNFFGRSIMTFDGELITASGGDITGVSPGRSHGLVNDGGEDLRIFVIGLY